VGFFVFGNLLTDPWPWWLGGICIGLLVPLMYYFTNTALGVSTGYGNLARLIFFKTRLKWLHSDAFKNIYNWRFFFIIGIVIGAFISAQLAGMLLVTSDMGRFTQMFAWPFLYQALWFFAGGFLLGLGARTANGCTSGHSIHGLANFHLSSLIATVFFLLFGFLTVHFISFLQAGGM